MCLFQEISQRLALRRGEKERSEWGVRRGILKIQPRVRFRFVLAELSFKKMEYSSVPHRPPSFTHQFNTWTTSFQHPKSLSLTSKTPEFNTKNHSARFYRAIFCHFFMLNWEVCWSEGFLVWNWGILGLKRSGPSVWNWCVELRGVWNWGGPL